MVAGVIALGLLLGCFIHPEVLPVLKLRLPFSRNHNTVGIHHILPGRLPLFFSGAFRLICCISGGSLGGGPFVQPDWIDPHPP